MKDTDKSGSVKCSQCDRWWHGLTCTTLNAEALKCLWDTYDASGHHWWACEGCTQAYMTLTKRMNQWERDMANLKATVTTNTELAKEASAKADKAAEDIVEVNKCRKLDKNEAINEATKRMSAELLDREGKKSNLMLYGLNEPPTSVKGVERKNIDIAGVKGMFTEMNVKPETNDEIKFSFRVGELTDKVVDEPRPLCIGLRNTEARDHVLSKAKNLGKSRNFYSISIVPDLTKMQREEDRNLKNEADQKNRDMTEDERLNWNYRCIGTKGARKVVKMRVRQNGPRDLRTPHQNRQLGTNSNLEPLGSQHPPPPGTAADSESEEENNGWSTIPAQARKRPASRSPGGSSPTSPNYYPPRPNQQVRYQRNKKGRGDNPL